MKISIKKPAKSLFLILIVMFGVSLQILAATTNQVTETVVMETSLGSITIELYGEAAPLTVANFLRYVDSAELDGGEFYRVVTYANDNGSPRIEVIQGGLNDRESPFTAVAHESTEVTGITHTDGVVSMARGEVDTASSEFFICIGDQPGLDHGQPRNADGQGFAAFGRVISGMEVVRAINTTSAEGVTGEGYTAGQILLEPVRINTVRRL